MDFEDDPARVVSLFPPNTRTVGDEVEDGRQRTTRARMRANNKFIGNDADGNGGGGGNAQADEVKRRNARSARWRRFNNPDDPNSFSAANGVGGIATACICCIFVLILVLLIVFVVVYPSLQYARSEGCTQSDFDNYQRGFGIDNGSCVIAQKQDVLSVCDNASHVAHYYDSGGANGTHALAEDTTLTFRPASSLVGVCVDFHTFSVVGGDADCSHAYLKVSGSKQDDGVYCNERRALPRHMICSAAVGKDLVFQFVSNYGAATATSSPATDAEVPESSKGWNATLHCGVPGCTHSYFANYDAAATLDDRTCVDNHGADDVTRVCTNFYWYDSGGANDTYKANEFTGRAFIPAVEDRVLCFEFDDFEVNGGIADGTCNDASSDWLEIANAATDAGKYCSDTGKSVPEHTKICSKEGGEPIYMHFYSNADGDVGAGWRAYVTCE